MRVCLIPPQHDKSVGLTFVAMEVLPLPEHFIMLPTSDNLYRAHKIVHRFKDVDAKHTIDVYLTRVRPP